MRRVLSSCALAALLVSAAGCFPVPPNIPSSPRRFDAKQMEGTWYVIATNFPSWLGEKNKDAHLSYKLRKTPEGVVELDDLVAFKSNGDPSSYAGVDTQDWANDAHFTWRGNGFLALFPTEWYVAKVDPKDQWIITYYGDTLVSADAVDVIARRPDLPEADLKAALAAIDADPVLKTKAHGMRHVYLYGDQPRK
jgi:lipocalin